MFRKGPSKAPKLNPVGISSKDYFADGSPSSAPIPAFQAEDHVSIKSTKLTRKLSGVSSALSQSVSLLSAVATPQSLTPKSTNTPGFTQPGLAAFSCDGIREPGEMGASTHTLNTPPTSSDNQHPSPHRQNYHPERQLSPGPNLARNQPRLPTNMNLDPLHTTAKMPSEPKQSPPSSETLSSSSAKSLDSSDMHSADVPQNLTVYSSKPPDIPVLHSAAAVETEKANGETQIPEERKRRGSLWRTKLGFTNLRRPETRRQRHQSYDNNAVDIAAHPQMYEESPLTSVPSAAPAASHGQDPGARSSQPSLEAFLGLADGAAYPHSRVSFASLGQSNGVAGFAQTDADSDTMSSVSNLGTIDKDFLLTIQRNSALEARRQRRRDTRRNTFRPSSSDGDKKRQEPVALHRKSLSEAGGAFMKKKSRHWDTAGGDMPESLSTAHRDTSNQYSRMARVSPSQSKNGMAISPPPVPPLPLNSVLQAHKQTTRSPPSSLPSDGDAPRYTLSSRKYRNPISTLPPALQISPQRGHQNIIMRSPTQTDKASAANASQSLYRQHMHGNDTQGSAGWDATQAAGLHQYRIAASGQGHAEQAREDWLPIYSQGMKQANYNRKFSHPDAELQSHSNPTYSPVSSPDILSKSASSLAMRLSMDGSKTSRLNNIGAAYKNNNGGGHKHGISKFFSVAPSTRKAQQQKHLSGHGFTLPVPGNEPPPIHHQPDQSIHVDPPTSPVVSSLVGDPLARRRIRDQLASSMAFDRLLEEDDEFTMAISLTPTVAGISQTSASLSK
ncbi:hypothetical protein EV178_001883 [Coemansia sp. RSA 1646]|nr:hypothetical protein EV178_001883 [Coemansia sp. RSA 1646]